MNKQIISRFEPTKNSRSAIVSAYIQEDKLTELSLEDEQQLSILGSIYVGKVQNIVQNIQAAFIEIQSGVICYYSLEDLKNPVYTKKQGKKALVIGDELLVQVIKEGIKTKAPVVTTNLSFNGKYVILTTGEKKLGVSTKLSSGKREELRRLLEPFCEENIGVIVRTSAGEATEKQIIGEYENLKKEAKKLLEQAMHRTCFSKIYTPEPEYVRNLKKSYVNQLDEIITDDPEIYEYLKVYFEEKQPKEREKLRFYEDKLLPLCRLYNLPKQIEDAIRIKVWLKSGAYLIIEQTEAFTVIDINTGKFEGKKNRQETFLKINLEAAKEISRQLRLRNLSGIILIDFINLENQESIKKLLTKLEEYVKMDSVKTDVVDMTSLGIVEMTRKKERRSLSEMIKQLENQMGG